MKTYLSWQAEDIVRATHGECLQEHTWQAQGVSIDSRTTQSGDLFIALKGPSFDGHDYVGAAFAAGAAAAIVMRQPSQVPPQKALIFVKDTFTALEQLGQAGRERAQAQIIAVTGSVGKTSSKEMLRLMLSAVGSTYANEGSLNNHWGVPLSLSRLPADARYGVFEVGMNHAGELGPLSKQVRPHIALITTIEAVHLEFFASIEAIADAKAEIFQGLQKDGTVILNRDNSHYARLANAAKALGIKKILSFGCDSKADARLLDYRATPEGCVVKSDILGKIGTYNLTVPGEHLALNSVGALLAAMTAGGDLRACAAALAHYQQPKGRGVKLQIALPDGEITLLDESYNASPVAVRAAIKVLGQMTPLSGHRILVLGDMRELGATSAALHAGLAADIAAARITKVFTCGEMMEHLHNALPQELRATHAATSAELAPLVSEAVQAGDIVTVKGSFSMQMSRIVEALKALSPATQKQAS